MKRSRVVVPWPQGLHLRPAAKLVHIGRRFRSRLSLRLGDRVADLRSVLSIVALCASLGTTLEIEAVGVDEQIAAAAVEEAFSTPQADASDDAHPGQR